jgi:aspartate/methionine/tyrosine aminotransferase
VALANAGVLFAPGYCFDAPQYFRLGFGAQSEGFAQALNIVSDTLSGLRLSAVAGARR